MAFVSSDSAKNLFEQLRSATKENLFDVPVEAQIIRADADSLSSKETALVAQFEEAGGPPLITDGKPTVIRFVAWMAHASADAKKPYINANRLAFVKEELYEAAAKIGGTNPLVMDFNHSAVRPSYYEDSQKVIGIWHSASVAFNEKAEAWGILAQGVMFAWAHPEIANSLLADQERLGHVRFSMACISNSVEYMKADDGEYIIGHNPVFFTLSALDVDNADKQAYGLGKEGSSDPALEQKLTIELTQLASDEIETDDKVVSIADRILARVQARAQEEAEITEPLMQVASTKENIMTPEEIAALTASSETAQARVLALESLLSAQEARAVVAETRATEFETARDANASELEAANAEIARVSSELESASVRLAEIDAAATVSARETLVASRLASLPESFQKAFAKKNDDAQTRLKNKWADMNDDDFTFYVSEELLVNVGEMKVGYVERSEKEGILPTEQEDGENSVSARIARHKK